MLDAPAEAWVRAWLGAAPPSPGPGAGGAAVGGSPAAVVVVLGGPGADDPGRALAARLAGGAGGTAVPASVVLAARASRSLDRATLPAGLHCWGADPRTAGGVRAVCSRLLGTQPLAQVALLAPALPASGTLRSLQLYHALLEGLGQGVEVALYLGDGGQLPDRSHALQKVVYSAGGHCFEARGLWQKGGDPPKLWQRNLRLCAAQVGLEGCSEADGGALGGTADIIARGSGKGGAQAGCLPFPPVTLSVKDQMEAARAVVENELFLVGEGHSSWVPLRGSHLGRLVRSSSRRFTEGGYAELHYIKSNPCENGAYFELEAKLREDLDGEGGTAGGHPAVEPAGFIALSVYAPGKGVPTPYAPPGRQLACAQIDRLVVLPKWRGHGCFRVLIQRTCSAFCQHGYPVRIRTSNPHAREVLEGCGLFKYEGRILPGQQKCGVQKRRPRRVYVDLDPSGAPPPSSSGRFEVDESEVGTEGAPGQLPERRRFRTARRSSPTEAVLRRLNSILNRVTSDSAEKLLGNLENLGRDASAAGERGTGGGANNMRGCLQLLADTVVGHAVRYHGPGTSILLARCAGALARGVSDKHGRDGAAEFTESLVKALEMIRSAARQVLRATEPDVRAAPRFGGGGTDTARDWAAAEAAGRLEAAAHLEAGLCEVGTLPWEGALERCQLVFASCEGMSPGTTSRVQVAALVAACSFLSDAGPRAGPDCRAAVKGCVVAAERALSTCKAEARSRARERLVALVEAAAAGWPDASAGAAFSTPRGVGAVRREAAQELGVELAPGRGEREGWAFWFSARDVRDPSSGALWAFRGARAPGGPFAQTN